MIFAATSLNVFATDYPSIVYPEDYNYTSQYLNDGGKVTITPQWIQKADYLGGADEVPFFAASGDHFYLYSKSDGKLLQYDRVHGIFEKEIDIEQNKFVNKENIGFFGADESQNLYVSSRFESDKDFDKGQNIDALNINVINAEGKIIKTLHSDPMSLIIGKTTEKESYSNLNIRGDITKENGFLVTLPIIFKIKNYNKPYTRIQYQFFQKSNENTLIDLGGDAVNYHKYGNPDNEVVFEKYSIFPINWIKDKCINDYYFKNGDENNEYFYALTRTANKNYQEICNFYYKNGVNKDNALLDTSLGFKGTYLPGGIACKYGDADLIVDANIGEDNKLHFNIREITFEKGGPYATPKKSKLLWTLPQDTDFLINSNDYYENVSIQAIESEEDGNPRVDIYMYAPGKIMAYYTISKEKVSTGYYPAVIDTTPKIEYVNGELRVSTESEVTLYDITGRQQARYANHKGTINLDKIPSGIYIAKTENAVIKIVK